MTQTTGSDHPRVVSAIDEAIQLAANGQISVAVQLLTNLAEEFPLASSVHGYLAWFLLQTGRHLEAIEHSREAVRTCESISVGLSPFAPRKRRSFAERKATLVSASVLSLSPKSERASLVHFHVLWKAGQRLQALDEMKRFLLIRPSEEYANIIKECEPGSGTHQNG